MWAMRQAVGVHGSEDRGRACKMEGVVDWWAGQGIVAGKQAVSAKTRRPCHIQDPINHSF